MESWIGEVVGRMHINKIKQDEVALKMGIRRDYFNKIINGKEKPKGIEKRINEAVDSILSDRENKQ